MIRSLIRRDSALEGLRSKWPVVSLVLGTFMVNLVTFISASDRVISDPLLLAGLWLMPSLYFVFGPVRERYRDFDLALPISSSRLWFAHSIALFVGGLVMLSVTVFAVKGFDLLMVNVLDADLLSDVHLIPLTLQTFGWLVLAIAVLQSIDVAQSQISAQRPYRRLATAVVSVLGLLMMAGSLVSPWLAIVPVIIAVVLLLRLYRTLPVVFSVVPREAGDPGARAGSIPASPTADPDRAGRLAGTLAANRPGALRWNLLIIPFVYRTLSKNPWGMVILAVMSLFIGMLLTDVVLVRYSDSNMRLAMIPMMSYMLMSGTMIVPMRMFLLDALPICRRWCFFIMIVPGLLGLGFGYGLGNLIVYTHVESPPAITCTYEEADHQGLRVLPKFFEIAADGQAPLITAPWGETCQSWSLPIGSVVDAILYKPFTTNAGSSPRFIAWQMSRAIEAIYGESIDPAELESRYVGTDLKGLALVSPETIPIAEDYPHLRMRGDGPFFPLIFAIVVVFWLLAYAVYLRSCRPGISSGRRKVVFWSLMASLFSLYFLSFGSWLMGWIDPDAEIAMVRIWIRHLPDIVPGGTPMIYALCGMLVFGAYQITLRQFLRFESNVTTWEECRNMI